MKLVESHERLVKINGRSYWVYVDEYKTIWSMYCKRTGHTLCSASDWRYKKSKFKDIDSVVERIHFINSLNDMKNKCIKRGYINEAIEYIDKRINKLKKSWNYDKVSN